MGDAQTTEAAETTRVKQKTEDRPPHERESAPRACAEALLFRAAVSDDPRTPPQHMAPVLRRLAAPQQTGFLLQCQRHYGNAYVQRMVSSLDNGQPSVLKKEEEDKAIQPRSAGSLADSFEAGADVETQVSLSKGCGSPLSDPARAYMEPRFGVDFSHVHVHTGVQTAVAAPAIHARAFTFGPNVVFGQGQYRPRSEDGRRLLGQELVHTVQQRPGPMLHRALADGP